MKKTKSFSKELQEINSSGHWFERNLNALPFLYIINIGADADFDSDEEEVIYKFITDYDKQFYNFLKNQQAIPREMLKGLKQKRGLKPNENISVTLKRQNSKIDNETFNKVVANEKQLLQLMKQKCKAILLSYTTIEDRLKEIKTIEDKLEMPNQQIKRKTPDSNKHTFLSSPVTSSPSKTKDEIDFGDILLCGQILDAVIKFVNANNISQETLIHFKLQLALSRKPCALFSNESSNLLGVSSNLEEFKKDNTTRLINYQNKLNSETDVNEIYEICKYIKTHLADHIPALKEYTIADKNVIDNEPAKRLRKSFMEQSQAAELNSNFTI